MPLNLMTNSLNSAAVEIFWIYAIECLRIIESKSKVRNSRNKAVVAIVSSNSSTPGYSPDVAALTTEVSKLKNMMKTMIIDKQKAQAPATVKAVEQSCVTCEGAYSYRNCPATDGNNYRDNIQEIPKPKAKETVQEPNSPDPDSCFPKLPYPERMKVREKDKPSAQQSRFMKLFKQLRLEIGLKDALIEMPKSEAKFYLRKKTSGQSESSPMNLTLLDSNFHQNGGGMEEDVENNNSNVSNSDEPVLLNTPLSDRVECSVPEDDVDEIDAFLAMEVSDLMDVSVSDLLHHEFDGESITLPSRIVREHEEYLNLMTLLCEISTTRSPDSFHANPSSITASPDPVQEEIDIVQGDLIPPGVELLHDSKIGR
ncbi:hypothetical protein Tco_0657742 [Tanacetum coccineum]